MNKALKYNYIVLYEDGDLDAYEGFVPNEKGMRTKIRKQVEQRIKNIDGVLLYFHTKTIVIKPQRKSDTVYQQSCG